MSRNTRVPFFRPSFGAEEFKNIRQVLKSGWLTSGKFSIRLEEEFKNLCGAKHAISCNSATAGLHLALEALGPAKGKYVITSPYTFTSSAETARYLDAVPLFVDIDEHTLNIDPDRLEKTLAGIRGKVHAIMPVHVAGLPCAMDRINRLAGTIPVIEDAAHAFPVRYGNSFCGNLGTAGVFSFYANKTITSGEGGMVLCNDDTLAARIRLMRTHGMDKASWNRYTDMKASWQYDILAPGYKYNMPDLNAAVGVAQLKKAFRFREQRARAAAYYLERFAGTDFIRLPETATEHAWHLFIIRLDLKKITITRDDFIGKLRESGIGCSVHFIPLHMMTYYKKEFGFKAEDFPKALAAYKSAISLPLFPGITRRQLALVADTVINIGKRYYNKN